MFAAAELARHGVDARLIEREVRPHHEARATTIQPGTLEILESVGLLAPFLDAAERVRRVRVYGPDLSELSALDFEGIDCRCEFQASLPQHETQRILETHLASLARLGRRWFGLVQISHDPDTDPVRAGVPKGGAVMIRPDGHIGFRSGSADAEALAALDRHLSSYLTPDPTV